jgi:hypothetical protein
MAPSLLGIFLWMRSRNDINLLVTMMTTLRQKRGKIVMEFTNTFHTLRTKLGIKDSERHMVLKYCGALHRYIQTEMDFLNISSLTLLIDMLSKLRKNLSTRENESSRLQIHNN